MRAETGEILPVEETNASSMEDQCKLAESLKLEVAYIRDQQFEFAASHFKSLLYHIFVCVIFNKMLQLLWKNIGVCELYGNLRIRC